MKDVFELNACGERIKLLGMETICSSMYRAPVPRDILNLFKGIPFQEDYAKGQSVRIDILTGLDWYWPLIKSQRTSTQIVLLAQETIFGWMLSGVFSHRKKIIEGQDFKLELLDKLVTVKVITGIPDDHKVLKQVIREWVHGQR